MLCVLQVTADLSSQQCPARLWVSLLLSLFILSLFLLSLSTVYLPVSLLTLHLSLSSLHPVMRTLSCGSQITLLTRKAFSHFQHCRQRVVCPLARPKMKLSLLHVLFCLLFFILLAFVFLLPCPPPFPPPPLSAPAPVKLPQVLSVQCRPAHFLIEMLRSPAARRGSMRFCFWFSSKMFFLALRSRT